MTCFTEDRFVELLDRPASADERGHLERCPACRESWGSLAAAADVLTDARPKPAASRGWKAFPVAVAAAILLAIVGVVVVRSPGKPRPQDPLVEFLERGSTEARSALLRGGRASLPGLMAARPRLQGSARLQALHQLAFDIKVASAQDPEALEIFRALAAPGYDLNFKDTDLRDVVDFVRSVSKANILLDPTVNAGRIDHFDLRGATLKEILELLCSLKGLDFDVRYGMVFISTPLRLWSQDPAVGLPTANHWQSQAPGALGEKLAAIRLSIDMEQIPMGTIAEYLTEITGLKCAVETPIAAEPVTFKAQDVRLHRALEALTIPLGWDVRIDDGVLRVVRR